MSQFEIWYSLMIWLLNGYFTLLLPNVEILRLHVVIRCSRRVMFHFEILRRNCFKIFQQLANCPTPMELKSGTAV